MKVEVMEDRKEAIFWFGEGHGYDAIVIPQEVKETARAFGLFFLDLEMISKCVILFREPDLAQSISTRFHWNYVPNENQKGGIFEVGVPFLQSSEVAQILTAVAV